MFVGKKVLFIGPKFHNYEKMIKGELENKGASVVFYPERSYGYDFNIINNFFPSKLESFQNRHYNDILEKCEGESFDYLFVIRGYMMPSSFLKVFRSNNPSAVLIMYQWDSQKTNPFMHLIGLFDKVKTFDFKDHSDLSIEYVPLFYTLDVQKISSSASKMYDYDFFFMGFFFPERYEAVKKFKIYCEENGYKLKPFLFMPITTRIKYFFKRVALDKSIVSFKPMERKEYLSILKSSRVMVDVSNPRQTGLAMRVIESLACGTKIATNNRNIQKSKKISESGMVSLFDLKNIEIDKTFVYSDFCTSENLVLSLPDWIDLVFSDNNDEE